MIPKEASHNDLYITYQKSVIELFNSAESHDIAQFVFCLMPPTKKLPTPAGGMFYEILEMVN